MALNMAVYDACNTTYNTYYLVIFVEKRIFLGDVVVFVSKIYTLISNSNYYYISGEYLYTHFSIVDSVLVWVTSGEPEPAPAPAPEPSSSP